MPGLNPGPKSRIQIRHYRPLLQESITFLHTILSISPSFPGSRGPPGTSRDRLLAPSQRFFGGWAPGTSPGPQYGRWAMGHQVGVPPGALAHPFLNRFLCPWVRWKATDWGFPAHLGVQKRLRIGGGMPQLVVSGDFRTVCLISPEPTGRFLSPWVRWNGVFFCFLLSPHTPQTVHFCPFPSPPIPSHFCPSPSSPSLSPQKTN